MTIEDRVRDALHDYADPIEPTPGSWERISSRLESRGDLHPPRRSQRRPLVLTGIALALVVVVVVGLVLRDDGDSSLVTTRPAGGDGASTVIASLGSELVVLDGPNGEVQRTLFEHGGITSVTPAVDGTAVYVVANEPGPCRGGPETFRVSLAGGDAVKVTTGVSSLREFRLDGRALLAYTGAIDCSDAGRVIQYGGPTIPSADPSTDPPEVRFPDDTTDLQILDVSPNGRSLLLRVTNETGPALFLVDVPTGTRTAIPTTDQMTTTATFVSDGLITVMASRFRPGSLGGTDPHNGAVGPMTIDLQGRIVSGVVPWVESSLTFTSIDEGLDGSLVAVTDTGALYLEGELVTLPGPAVDATWLREVRLPQGPSSDMPKGIAVVRPDGRIADISPVNGAEHSTLGQAAPGAQVGAAPDGRTLAVASVTQTPGCVNPASRRLELWDVVSGARRGVAPAYSPAVGPNGLVAYGISCDTDGLGMTRLATGENHRSDALGGRETESDPRIEAVSPLGWSPDGTRLVYWVGLDGDDRRHLYVGRLWPAVRAAQTEVTEVQVSDRVVAAAFYDDETLAIAEEDADGTKTTVGFRRLATSSGIRPGGFEVPGRVTSLVADPRGRHFLAVTGEGTLYRWSARDQVLTKLAEDVTAATWLPW